MAARQPAKKTTAKKVAAKPAKKVAEKTPAPVKFATVSPSEIGSVRFLQDTEIVNHIQKNFAGKIDQWRKSFSLATDDQDAKIQLMQMIRYGKINLNQL